MSSRAAALAVERERGWAVGRGLTDPLADAVALFGFDRPFVALALAGRFATPAFAGSFLALAFAERLLALAFAERFAVLAFAERFVVFALATPLVALALTARFAVPALAEPLPGPAAPFFIVNLPGARPRPCRPIAARYPAALPAAWALPACPRMLLSGRCRRQRAARNLCDRAPTPPSGSVWSRPAACASFANRAKPNPRGRDPSRPALHQDELHLSLRGSPPRGCPRGRRVRRGTLPLAAPDHGARAPAARRISSDDGDGRGHLDVPPPRPGRDRLPAGPGRSRLLDHHGRHRAPRRRRDRQRALALDPAPARHRRRRPGADRRGAALRSEHVVASAHAARGGPALSPKSGVLARGEARC